MQRFDPFRELDRLARDGGGTALQGMPMDLYRQDDRYVLSMDLPGVDPGSVDIDVDGQLLTIRAERTLRNGDDVQWLTRERVGGSFVRQLSLGRGIDTAGISAHYEHGVLHVLIPVSEKAKPRKIEVISGSSAAAPLADGRAASEGTDGAGHRQTADA